MNSPEPQLVEHIVRAVLQRLQHQGGTARSSFTAAPATATANGSSTSNGSSGSRPASAGSGNQQSNTTSASVTLAERVITADLLERHRGAGKSGSTLRFRILPDALLTPAANDWLREQGAQLTREANLAAEQAAGSGSWAILTGTHSPVVENAVSDVTRRLSTHCRRALCSSTAEAVEQAISRITRGEQQGVVLITDRPALAACIANRQPLVRAAAVCGRQLDEALLTGLDPNVLCLSPAERTFIELRNMLEHTVRRVPAPPGQQPGL